MSQGHQQDRWLDVKKRMGDRRVVFGRHLAYWYDHSPRRLLHCMSYYKFASKLIGPGKRVLDIGCGEGIGTWLLAVENGFAHGVDLDEDAVACARRNFGHDPRIRFSCEDFLQAPPQEWDAVVNFDVIEHILPGNVPAFWSQLAKNLAHDGILVVGTPNITSDQYAGRVARAGHVNLYSGERLGAEMREHFHHVFLFAGNDEVVHTGFLPMAHYLLAVGCRKRAGRGPDGDGATQAGPGQLDGTRLAPEEWTMASSPFENDLDLTLFISCYNEEANIVGTLETVLEALGEFDFTWEIIIIDDASTDRSVEVIQDFLCKHPDLPITLKTREFNVGLAQNYIEGAFLGRGKYYRLICGDNVEPKETLVEVFKHLGEADMVLFYQDITGKSLSRRILSRCYTWLVNLITSHRIKYYNGLALHRRYNVMRWHTNYHGFGFQADMIARLLDEGFGYTEVRVKAIERKAGISHALTLRNFFSVAHTLLDLLIRRVARWRAAPRRAAQIAAAESLQQQAR